jgi:G protein-coupled receptor 107
MFILFSAGLAIWSVYVYRNKSNAHRIHYLMIVLGVFKVLTLLAQCGMYHYIRITGHPDGWNVAFYIFTLFRSIFLFSVIILIGTGWSYMTPFLGENERRILMVVIPLQVLSLSPLLTARFCSINVHCAQEPLNL